MPNWCLNNVKIFGDVDKMKPLIEKFEDLKKNPDNYTAQYVLGDEYEFEDDFNFDRRVSELEITDKCITFNLMTAWTPPDDFMKDLCKKYEVCATVSYDEPGIGLNGISHFNF